MDFSTLTQDQWLSLNSSDWQTLRFSVPGSVTNLTLHASKTSLSFSWNATPDTDGYYVSVLNTDNNQIQIHTVVATSFLLNNLVSGVRYNVWISAFNNAGEGSPSEILEFIQLILSGTQGTFEVPNLVLGETYQVWAAASNSFGESDPCTPVTITVTNDVEPPTSPSWAIDASGTILTASFAEAVYGGDGYRFSRDGGQNYTDLPTGTFDVSHTSLSWIIAPVYQTETGFRAAYRLPQGNTVDSLGNVLLAFSDSDIDNGSTVPIPAPPKPGKVTVFNANGKAFLRWSATARATGYKLYWRQIA